MGILAASVKHYESTVCPPLFKRFPLKLFWDASHSPSFIVVIACYKSSCSFSVPSQVHLEEVCFGGPKLNYHTPKLHAPVPCMLTP